MSDQPDCGQVSWYALTTRPQHEKSAAQALLIRGFQVFLPLHKSRRQWSDRKKTLELPLFPGYVFCRFTPEQRLKVVTSPNVTAVVGIGKRPCPVADVEIQAIQTMVGSGLPLEPWQFLEIGQKVRIEGGSLDGLSGILVQERNSLRVVVNVNLLHRSVAVEISRENLVADSFARVAAQPRGAGAIP